MRTTKLTAKSAWVPKPSGLTGSSTDALSGSRAKAEMITEVEAGFLRRRHFLLTRFFSCAMKFDFNGLADLTAGGGV